jgi:polyisoprenoid-binding protein YceI
MKKIATLAIIALALFTVSCKNETKTDNTETAVSATELESREYVFVNDKSTIEWTGYGLGSKSHNGTVKLSAGKLEVKEGKLSAGKLVIDMNSITVLDITDATDNQKLTGHLKDKDFFGVETYPAANLQITDASDLANVKANLTLKDVTKEVVFPITIEKVEGGLMVSVKFDIDRTQYGITYNSGQFFPNIGDYLIKDNMTIAAKIFAK